jgi:hypothetical protein
VMLGQGHAALLALEDGAAEQAEHHRGIAAAIKEKKSLFPPRQNLAHRLGQGRGDDLQAGAAPLLLEVDQLHLRQGLGGDPPGQGEIAVPAFPGPEIGAHRRGGGHQGHRRTGQLPPVEGHVPGLVGEAPFVLVGRVVFLVHHDEAEARQGRKHRGAGPHRHLGLPRGQAPPLIQALAVGQAAVQQGHPPPEAPAELHGHRVGEGDFGEQHQHLAPWARASWAAARYTSVLPLAVTPWSRKGANCPSLMPWARARAASSCSGTRVRGDSKGAGGSSGLGVGRGRALFPDDQPLLLQAL